MERNGHSRWTVPWNQYYVESIRSMWGPKNNCLHNSIPYCLLIQMQTTLQTFAKSQRYLHFSLTQRYPGKVINRAGRWRQLLRQCAVPLNGFQKCIEECVLAIFVASSMLILRGLSPWRSTGWVDLAVFRGHEERREVREERVIWVGSVELGVDSGE